MQYYPINAIEVGDIVVLDYTNIGCVKLLEIGDRLYGVASERINPQEYGNVIIKSRQNFREIGGLSADIESGRYYKAGDNGKLIETESSDAVFVCIGNRILCFL